MAWNWWERVVKWKTRGKQAGRARAADRRRTPIPLVLESLEDRTLLSSTGLVATTTSWAIAPTPTVYGQVDTFTAQVNRASAGSGKPTGQVVFKEGGTVIGSASLNSLSRATLSISTLGVGNHTLVAVYVASGAFAASASSGQAAVVSPAHDAVVLLSSPPSSVVLSNGQGITLTANVVGLTVGAGNPTGQVQFLDNGKPLGQATLDSTGQATLATSLAGPSSNSLTARYVGDAHFLGALSSPLTLQVSAVHKIGSATALTSPGNLAMGQPVPVVVQVSGTGSSNRPTGQIQFQVDGTNVGGPDGLDRNGKVSLSFSGMRVGSHIITATYLGDAHFAASSHNMTVQINAGHRAASVTTLTSSATVAVVGQQVVFSAQVATAPGMVAPTNKVQFMVDGKAQLPVALDLTGRAALAMTFSQSGNHTVTADYLGDARYAPGNSRSVSVQVGAPQRSVSVTTLTASATAVKPGQQVTLTAHVTAASGAIKPTGKVQFMVDGKAQGVPVVLDPNGKAALTITLSLAGKHTITVDYLGDARFATSASKDLSVQVQTAYKFQTATTLVSSTTSSIFGKKVTFTAKVAASGSGAAIPPGKVEFLNNGALLGQLVTLDSNGKAVFASSTLPPGTYHITVKYFGGNDYGPSTTKDVVLKVSPAA